MKKMTAIVFLLTVVLMGCGKNDGGIRVLLDWTPNTNHTGLYVALEKGWFAEEGLRVTITQPPEDNALMLLAAGKAEFAINFQDWMGQVIAKEHDALPITAIAAIISHNTSGIMSLKESGIQRPADLSGKRFASWDIPVVTAIIRHITEKDGGDFNTVRMIPNFATDVFSALQTDVDAVWVYYAFDCIPAELNGIDFNYIDLGTFDSLLDYYTPVLVTNTNWAAANPQTVKKFMNAVSRGYNFAIENPQEAAEIILKHAPEMDREIAVRSQEYLQTRYQGSADRWGEIDPDRWGSFYTWMYDQGLLETDIGTGGFTNEYLPHF
ncbi:MAG: ABC transporter substrate-binding protein [Treponema sp.]|nr:ABC transporter substrate-binding protein [Treponema sp.]